MASANSASTHELRLTTLKGNTITLQWIGGSHPYTLMCHDERREEGWSEALTSDAAHDIVEFIGYPQEVPPERATVEHAIAVAQEAKARLSQLQSEHERMRSYAAILVNELQGAWWLKAARAYEELRALLMEEQ